MPELVGFAAQGKPVIWRYDRSVRADGTQDHKMRTRTLRADLGHFRWPEAARKGELNFVGHLLLTQDQNGMLLKGSAHRRICGIVRGDIRKRHTAQFGGESRTQRHNVHRQVLPVIIARNFTAELPGRQRHAADAVKPGGTIELPPTLLVPRRGDRLTRPTYTGLPTG